LRWNSSSLRRRTLVAAGAALAVLCAVMFLRPYDHSRFGHGDGVTLLDRSGQVLRRSGDGAQWVPLERISGYVIAATLASEDGDFLRHHGVDAIGLSRAMWLDARARRAAYGGSTITMQLARLLSEADEPHRRSLAHKLSELIDATRIERALSKHEILEQYLNRAYYGNRAVGVEAAAQFYFDKPAALLSLSEASLLTVLPRAPSAYDPWKHMPVALARRDHVLDLMQRGGFATAEQVRMARAEPLALRHTPSPFLAPHFCDHVLFEAHERHLTGTVRTTLDAPLQARLETAVSTHLAALARKHVTNAGLLVLDDRGAVRALVGSASYFDADHAGAVDIALVRRSPGSTLKPFLYALALEAGDAPASVAYDVRDCARKGGDESESPCLGAHNADGKERGPSRYRDALGSSLNLAALDVLDRRVGLARLVARLREAQVLPPGKTPTGRYGPGLVLGAAAVRPLDLAAAFSAFAHEGSFAPWHDLAGDERPPRRLFSPQVAWLVGDMLSDAAARRPVFGEDLPLDLPFRVMAKTGTSAGFADNLTIAATREYTVLAWAGNFDGSPMHGVLAMRGAAPLVRAALLALGEREPLTLPERPAGVVARAVCPLSGLLAGPHCPTRKQDWFREGTVPTQTCPWHKDEGRIQWPPALAEWARRHAPAQAQRASLTGSRIGELE
jgi:penicillin-binding protein 1C